MKPFVILGLLLASLACEGPARPGLMFPERKDAGAPSQTDAGDGQSEAPRGDGGPLNPGAPIDCAELTRCMATCSGSRCGPQCLERANARTQEIYSRVSSCAARNECRAPECIQTNCAEEWLDCQENIHPSERLHCASLRRCELGCVGDENCLAHCQAEAYSSEALKLAELRICARETGCADEACLRRDCEQALALCYPEGEHLRLSCIELVGCIDACEDAACTETCTRQGRAEAQRDLIALDDCQIACGPDPEDCRELCGAEMARCGR